MNNTIKAIPLILFFSMSSHYGNDLSLPSYPVEPGVPQQNNETKNQPASVNTVRMEVIVILGTTDEVRGYIYMPEKMSFKHYKNGLVYDKIIHPEDLQSVNVLEYSKKDDGNKGKVTFYQFEPSSVEIKLKDNSLYRVEKIFPFLKSFNIETNNGRTRLFTIFGDTYEKPKGWRDAESKDPEYHHNRPHPASAKKILFIRIEKE